jgi:dihydroflavonol-4-reductase
MPSKVAFVTGGTGFIGLNLVAHLSQSGWDVIALHRPDSRLTELRKYPVRLVEGAIEDALSLQRAMPEDLDAVFHVAGDTSMWRTHKHRQWSTNVDGTRNMVATALAKRSKRFIHTSTSGVYGIPARPFDETAPKVGKSGFPYQLSKAAAEDEVVKGIARGLDAVLLNPANVIGRYDWGSWSRFIRQVANREMLFIPPGSACFCDVGAVVRAHLMAVEDGRKGHNYLLGGPHASYAEVAHLIGELLGRPTNTRLGTPSALRIAGRALEWLSLFTRREPMISSELAAFLTGDIICRSDKAMRELDYNPASLEVMFKDCIDWMIAENIVHPA